MRFSNEIILKVWQKAEIDEYNVPNDFRKDQCGAWIERTQYGNHDSAYGWEINQINRTLDGDSYDLSNLRPLHWKNNFCKEDEHLTCPVRSSGTINVKTEMGKGSTFILKFPISTD